MKKAVISIVLAVPLVTGCGVLDFFKKKDAPIITDKRVNVDPKLLEPCKPLVTLSIPLGTKDPAPYLLDNLAANVELFDECSKKQDASILVIRKFSNTDEKSTTSKKD